MATPYTLTLGDGRKVNVHWDRPTPPSAEDVDRLAQDAEEAFGQQTKPKSQVSNQTAKPKVKTLQGRRSGNRHADTIARIAQEEGVDPDLFDRLVRQESGYNERAVSKAGAQGLTQLMPGTARGLGVKDPFNPEENLRGGARYLRQQIEKFGGDKRKALAAYNAGPGAVQKYGDVPPYAETQAYVKRILGEDDGDVRQTETPTTPKQQVDPKVDELRKRKGWLEKTIQSNRSAGMDVKKLQKKLYVITNQLAASQGHEPAFQETKPTPKKLSTKKSGNDFFSSDIGKPMTGAPAVDPISQQSAPFSFESGPTLPNDPNYTRYGQKIKSPAKVLKRADEIRNEADPRLSRIMQKAQQDKGLRPGTLAYDKYKYSQQRYLKEWDREIDSYIKESSTPKHLRTEALVANQLDKDLPESLPQINEAITRHAKDFVTSGDPKTGWNPIKRAVAGFGVGAVNPYGVMQLADSAKRDPLGTAGQVWGSFSNLWNGKNAEQKYEAALNWAAILIPAGTKGIKGIAALRGLGSTLDSATVAAIDGAALETLGKIPKGHPMYAKAQTALSTLEKGGGVSAALDAEKATNPHLLTSKQAVELPVKSTAPITEIKSAEGFPVYETRMSPKDIKVSPGLQYKKQGIIDPVNAITDELKGVSVYDQATAPPLTGWFKEDGTVNVLNGHHRRELALRTGEADVPVRLFREADGIDFKTARALGALQNIRDGKGTSLDAVSVLKDLGKSADELKGYGINLRSGVGRDAVSLMNLDPESLRLIEEGYVTEQAAAGIADAKLPTNRQIAAIKEAGRTGLETRAAVADLAERAKTAPMVDKSGGMGDLFGEFSEELALGEQSLLAESVAKSLTNDQRLYKALVKGKAVGESLIDAPAQQKAAEIQAFAKQVMASDPETAAILQREAINYAKTPSKKQLIAATGRISEVARRAAAERLTELSGAGRSGQSSNTRLQSGSAAGLDDVASLSNKEIGGQMSLDPNTLGDTKGQLGMGELEQDLANSGQIKAAPPQSKTLKTKAVKEESAPLDLGADDANQGVIHLQSGVDIPGAIRGADDLNLSGSFKITSSRIKDYGAASNLTQPLSIVDGSGKTLQRGSYERIAGQLGKEVSETFRGAEQNIETKINDWSHKLDQVELKLKDISKNQKISLDKLQSDFIDLIEKDLTDPTRKADGALGEALKLHDELTKQQRDYIIETRRDAGIDTPDDWGITTQGYFRHLFLGDIRLFVDGKFEGIARTYAEAQKRAIDILDKNPKAKITAEARNTFAGDPTLRLNSGRYFKIANNIAERVGLTTEDIMQDLRGEIGRKVNRQKFYGGLLERKGTEGYSKAYLEVMRVSANQLARSQSLTALVKKVTPLIEKLRKEGYNGVAEAVEDHLNAVWGTPTKLEKQIGASIRNTPILRNHVAAPEMALRTVANRLTKLQSLLKLSFNVRSSAVNLLQPLSTLWPYVSTKDFASLYTEILKPSVRASLREKGVYDGATKLAQGDVTKVAKLATPFQKASEVNRGIGYLFGYKDALKAGASEAVAHKTGLAWAEKVEFDNSVWNIQPLLRSPQARILGQFRAFQGKALENVADAVRLHEGDTALTRTGRIGKLATAQVGLGGAKSLGMAAKVFGGYQIAQALHAYFTENGMSDEEAKKWSEAVFYGAPSLIGIDLSSSLAIAEEPYGRTGMEKIGNLAGPTVGTIVGVSENLAKANEETGAGKTEAYYKAGKAASSYVRQGRAIQDIVQSENHRAKVKLDRDEVELPPFESVMYALGFTPTLQSSYYDEKDAKAPNPRMEFKGDAGDLLNKLNYKPGAPKRVEGEKDDEYKARVKAVETEIQAVTERLLENANFKRLTKDQQKEILEQQYKAAREKANAPFAKKLETLKRKKLETTRK